MKINFYLKSLGLILALIGLNAHAGGGSFQSVLTGNFEWKSLDTVDGSVMSGAFQGIGMVVEGDGIFKSGMASRGECLVRVRNHPGGRDINAECAIDYPELDSKMFMLLERKAGDIANAGAKGDGTQTILGGTNKLKGITGTCSYSIKYLDAVTTVSNNNCSYSL